MLSTVPIPVTSGVPPASRLMPSAPNSIESAVLRPAMTRASAPAPSARSIEVELWCGNGALPLWSIVTLSPPPVPFTWIAVTVEVSKPPHPGSDGVSTMARGSASPLSESAMDSPPERSIVIVAPPEHVTANAGTALRPTMNAANSGAAQVTSTRRTNFR
jgi:hypothetical protein